MKYNIERTTIQYFKHADGTEVFFRGKFSPEARFPIEEDIQQLINQGQIEIIEKEEDAFVEEVIKHVIPLKDYKVIRQYPNIGEQLDMLWHELNVSGSISNTGQWFQSVQSIKEQYPKS